ncbi:MAG: sulfur carrier protein ThiS [bacterium]|nr:sulfur carrier protein ThiS [Candidatus Margulisiibacteriota bacterium]
MAIRVNGELKEMTGKITVAKLLENHGFKPELTVVQINHEIVPKEKYDEHIIDDGDEVELIKFMAGG